MRYYEFAHLTETASAGSTSSGSVATVAMPMGGMQRRVGDTMFFGKYTDDATPNTPESYKQYKRKKNVS